MAAPVAGPTRVCEAAPTADGLVQIDRDGNVIKKLGEENTEPILPVGTKVSACYRVKEQFGGQEDWYDGVIAAVNQAKDGTVTYNVDYEDGDFENDVEQQHVKPKDKTEEEQQQEVTEAQEAQQIKRKRQRAKDKAR